MNYTVTTIGSLHWQVVRDGDGRVMTSGTVKECLRWVKAWGDVDLGR